MLLGVTLVANGVNLDYPFEPCIRNLSACCDNVYINTDIHNKDNTLEILNKLQEELKNITIIESEWDWSINNGRDLAKRINDCLDKGIEDGFSAALYVQADEIVNPMEINYLKSSIDIYNYNILLERTYFWRDLEIINSTWTLPIHRMCRLTKSLRVVGDGMYMQVDNGFKSIGVPPDIARIYHYSRVGETQKIAERLNNLDSLFHSDDEYDKLEDYEFGKNNNFESGANKANTIVFDGNHPPYIRNFYE